MADFRTQAAQERKATRGQPDSDAAILGRNIKAGRERLGMSQTALAEWMAAKGHSAWRQTTVSRSERGDRVLTAGEVFALEELLGGLWLGTTWGREMKTLGGRLILTAVEQQMARVEGELAELRRVWNRAKKALREREPDDGEH